MKRCVAVLGALALTVSAAFGSEPRMLTLAANNTAGLPEDDLDVYYFPQNLDDKDRFVYADATADYIAYAGSNWMMSINRSNSGIRGITLDQEPILDLGWASGDLGVLAHIGLNDPDSNSHLFTVGGRVGLDLGDIDVAAEVDFLDDDVTDNTGIQLVGDARVEIGHEYFDRLIAGARVQNDYLTEGTNFDVTAILARNGMVTRRTRLLYGIGAGFELIEDEVTRVQVPTHIGAEFEARRWLTLRAGGTKNWILDSWDEQATGANAIPDETTFNTVSNVNFGFALHKEGVTVDFLVVQSLLEDGLVLDTGTLSQHTAVTYRF